MINPAASRIFHASSGVCQCQIPDLSLGAGFLAALDLALGFGLGLALALALAWIAATGSFFLGAAIYSPISIKRAGNHKVSDSGKSPGPAPFKTMRITSRSDSSS